MGTMCGWGQLRGCACFAEEAFAEVGVNREVPRQYLDRHGPIQARLAGEVDDAHAALAEEAGEGVLAGEGELEGVQQGVGHNGRCGNRARPT